MTTIFHNYPLPPGTATKPVVKRMSVCTAAEETPTEWTVIHRIMSPTVSPLPSSLPPSLSPSYSLLLSPSYSLLPPLLFPLLLSPPFPPLPHSTLLLPLLPPSYSLLPPLLSPPLHRPALLCMRVCVRACMCVCEHGWGVKFSQAWGESGGEASPLTLQLLPPPPPPLN